MVCREKLHMWQWKWRVAASGGDVHWLVDIDPPLSY